MNSQRFVLFCILIVTIISNSWINCLGQITIRKPISEEPLKIKYDSSRNILDLDCTIDPSSLIGQEIIFVKGNGVNNNGTKLGVWFTRDSVNIRSLVSDSLWAEINKPYKFGDIHDPSNKYHFETKRADKYYTKLYMPTLSPIKGYGNYLNFVVVNDISHFNLNPYKVINFASEKQNIDEKRCKFKIELIDRNGSIIKSEFNCFPWCKGQIYIKGYLDKLRNKYVGKTIYVPLDRGMELSFYNYLDNKHANFQKGTKLIIKDLTFLEDNLENTYPMLCLVAEDSLKQEVALFVEDKRNENRLNINEFWFEGKMNDYLEERAKEIAESEKNKRLEEQNELAHQKKIKSEILKRFGPKIGALINKSEVQLGMNKEMCEYAWGWPDRITNSVDGTKVVEVWFYRGGKWLKFRDNKLIQKSE